MPRASLRFRNLAGHNGGRALRVEVLAPGFAPLTMAVKKSGEVTARLKLAPQSETVVVSASPSPLEAGLTGLNVSTLDAATLTTLQPVAAADAIRFLPGVILADEGNRGGQTSLFIRGGDSDYNKVLVDGVPVDDPGGYFDFGTMSMAGVNRLELMRGSESVLYGSDAMSSVLQIHSAIGHTKVPELRFGGDGGNFGTAHGFASLAGADGRYDYNLFGDQFDSDGQGANDYYENSTEGANLGMQLAPQASVRLHVRHNDSRSGVPGETTFLGDQLFPPATDAWARQNNLLAALEFNLASPGQVAAPAHGVQLQPSAARRGPRHRHARSRAIRTVRLPTWPTSITLGFATAGNTGNRSRRGAVSVTSSRTRMGLWATPRHLR